MMVAIVTMKTSSSTRTVGRRWGNFRMEEAITHCHPLILMTLLITVIIEMNFYFLYNLNKQIRMKLLHLN